MAGSKLVPVAIQGWQRLGVGVVVLVECQPQIHLLIDGKVEVNRNIVDDCKGRKHDAHFLWGDPEPIMKWGKAALEHTDRVLNQNPGSLVCPVVVLLEWLPRIGAVGSQEVLFEWISTVTQQYTVVTSWKTKQKHMY